MVLFHVDYFHSWRLCYFNRFLISPDLLVDDIVHEVLQSLSDPSVIEDQGIELEQGRGRLFELTGLLDRGQERPELDDGPGGPFLRSCSCLDLSSLGKRIETEVDLSAVCAVAISLLANACEVEVIVEVDQFELQPLGAVFTLVGQS